MPRPMQAIDLLSVRDTREPGYVPQCPPSIPPLLGPACQSRSRGRHESNTGTTPRSLWNDVALEQAEITGVKSLSYEKFALRQITNCCARTTPRPAMTKRRSDRLCATGTQAGYRAALLSGVRCQIVVFRC